MFGSSRDVSPEERNSLSKLACGCGACGAREAARGDEAWRVLAAEALGTALLVALSCLPACAPAPPLQRALAAGLVVTVLVQCFDHVSGAMFNPTVTLAAALRGRVAGVRAASMLGAQLAGAAAGAGLLRLLAPSAPGACALCLTLPADHVSVYKAAAIEAVLGGCLALANCASWDARNRLLTDSWPARIGLIVAGLTLVAGELTGASMNPARSFGPALWAMNFDRHWVYWLGPLSGSALCSALYAWAWPAPPHAPARADPCCPRAPCAPGPTCAPL
ncbi:aquaporin-like [Ostrinia furnacalis]|uniref:aquaporin-like n=1 Tax=Ostrinia furnacalis TaxID=93504 RepID=UPI00103EED8B|nr:aquaporin-like [Ostrinia furnacalis]XP_028157513.1 aquaporin-like [Ostrinia furnacalis]XP_028157514.1 aquaporin-like [Ostrinia furnacalis]